MLDVETTARQVRAWLAERGFTQRDADLSDYQRGTDTRLRFKVGCSHGEVAVQVWKGKFHTDTHRAITAESYEWMLRWMAEQIAIIDQENSSSNGHSPADLKSGKMW